MQALDVAVNAPLKARISELADISYDENFAQWEKGLYTVGDRRVMLTKWVGQAWRELHAEKSDLIRSTFRKLGLSLAVDGSEDVELSIKDLPGMEVGDWRLTTDQVNEQLVENPVEIDEAIQTNPFENSLVDAEYVLKDENGGENKEKNQGKNRDENSNGELDSEELEN